MERTRLLVRCVQLDDLRMAKGTTNAPYVQLDGRNQILYQAVVLFALQGQHVNRQRLTVLFFAQENHIFAKLVNFLQLMAHRHASPVPLDKHRLLLGVQVVLFAQREHLLQKQTLLSVLPVPQENFHLTKTHSAVNFVQEDGLQAITHLQPVSSAQ